MPGAIRPSAVRIFGSRRGRAAWAGGRCRAAAIRGSHPILPRLALHRSPPSPPAPASPPRSRAVCHGLGVPAGHDRRGEAELGALLEPPLGLASPAAAGRSGRSRRRPPVPALDRGAARGGGDRERDRRGRRPARRSGRRRRRSRRRRPARARRRAWRPRTATIIARRFGSTPVPTRRGIARSVGATSAWISSRSGRVPSSAQATAAPSCAVVGAAEELGRVGDRRRGPLPVISKTPSSLVEPKRFFDGAQDAVRAVAVALELEHAVDEVLEHARAGDGAVLRHVADEERRRRRPPSPRAAAAPAASRTWPTEPGAEPSSDA